MWKKFARRQPQRASPARRIPISQPIELRFPHFEGFVTGVAANLSTLGMFIATDSPATVGTEFPFRFRIEDWSPIHGTARVVWTRSRPEGPDRPVGMGVAFLELDAQSRRMIRWLVDKHVREGGEPFDLDSSTGTTTRTPSHREIGSRSSRGDGRTIRRRRSGAGRAQRWRRPLVAVAAVLLLAVAAYGGYLLWRNGSARTPTRPASPRPSVASELDRPAPAAAEESAAPAGPSAAPANIESVTAVLRAWASAWTTRQVDEVTAFYSPEFVPEGSKSRAEWQAEVARRMRESSYIRVAVSGLDISFPTADRARASFFCSWRSDRFDETRRLTLELEPTAAGWRILSEQTGGD